MSGQNVIKDRSFSKLDSISCRTLLIYMHAELQTKLAPLFHGALNPWGWLFLGNSKSGGEYAELFATLNRAAKSDQRNDAGRQQPVSLGRRDAILAQDLAGKNLSRNSGAIGTYGWSEAEALSMSIRDPIPQASREVALSVVLQLGRRRFCSPTRWRGSPKLAASCACRLSRPHRSMSAGQCMPLPERGGKTLEEQNGH
jgi:hypothetical protein